MEADPTLAIPAIPMRADMPTFERHVEELLLGNAEGLWAALQPQVGLADRRLVGAEALVRWDHPTLGALSHGDLIAAAHRLRLMPQLGMRVRREAFSAVAWLRQRGVVVPRISVNASAPELAEPKLAEVFVAQAAEAGLPAEALEIEITEDVSIGDLSERPLATLSTLQSRGVTVALDDFGTGFAGLSHLLHLSIDSLKLDRCIVQAVGHSRTAEEIVRSVSAMAKNLGIRVVAEGVETKVQVEAMRWLGCDVAQGFVVGRPMSPNQFLAWSVKRERQQVPVTAE